MTTLDRNATSFRALGSREPRVRNAVPTLAPKRYKNPADQAFGAMLPPEVAPPYARPTPAVPKISPNAGKSLEELRAMNRPAYDRLNAGGAPANVSTVPPAPRPAAPVVTSSGATVDPKTGGTIAPGLPGGADPAQAGFGNQNPNRPTVPQLATPAAGAVPPPAPAPSATEQGVTEAEKQYKSSLGVTEAEKAEQRRLDALNARYATGGLTVRGQTIPQGLIVGQERALLEQQGIESAPIETRLARLQAERIGASDVAKFGLDRADKALERERGLNAPQTVSAGESIVQRQPGGEYKSIFTGPAKEEHSAIFKEYQDAKDAGYTGTFEQYQNDDANRKARANADANRVLSASEAQALGVPFGTTAAAAYGITPTKPLTEAQSRDLTYGTRGGEANQTINALEASVSGYNPVWFTVQAALEPNTIGNVFVPDQIRQIRQAERNFLTAVLRRESGAVISPSEFATGEKQYFPRPGDDAKTLEQKRQNRQTVIDSFMKAGTPGAGAAPASSGTGGFDW